MKQLLVKLDDGSGQIQARACTAKICNKFYPKIFQVISLLHRYSCRHSFCMWYSHFILGEERIFNQKR